MEKPSSSSVVQKESHKHVELVQTEEKMEFQPVASPSPQKHPKELTDPHEQPPKSLLAVSVYLILLQFHDLCCYDRKRSHTRHPALARNQLRQV